jgi:hypothetical protein
MRNVPTPYFGRALTRRQNWAIMVFFDELSRWGDDIMAGALPAPDGEGA